MSHQIRHLSFGMQDAKGWAERHAGTGGFQGLVLGFWGNVKQKTGQNEATIGILDDLVKVPVVTFNGIHI